MKIAYIMRGVPGSGKSTVARQLAGSGGVIHSTDEFFYANGRYCFDPSKLREYHDRNFQEFCRSLQRGMSVVICDNTNVRREHFARYVEAAAGAGYWVACVVMPHPKAEVAAQRTIHRVAIDTIQCMIDEWED